MSKKTRLGWFSVVLVIGVCFVYFNWFWQPTYVESMEATNGNKLKFRTQGDKIEIYQDQFWKPFFVKGINLGAALPGHYPGALPIKKEDYLRWFAQIDEMGANVIRVYTIHPPAFYEALVEYNSKKKGDPLYFMQGIWTPEEALFEKKDAYLPEISQEFRHEISDVVGAVYGKITIPEKPGKASGSYKVNAGQFLVGWHLGTEWEPLMVFRTNKYHQKDQLPQGTHFNTTAQATPFERWLGEMIDHLAEQEIGHGWQHPITFTNWVTTDPLPHPGEPLIQEDMVSVDPTHLKPVNWEAGYFASYHVYPYYPDFFRYDQSFQKEKNSAGKVDSYKSYLKKLKAYHKDMPIMVTEYGVPASLGNAHIGNLGRNQGGHTDVQQGNINAELMNEIVDEGYAGAILFVWQDEWFKKTWNTMKFELPEDRRSLWINPLTNESLFGVLGMLPGKEAVLTIDGKTDDWNKLKPEEKKRLDISIPGWKEIWVTHDEGYLYLNGKLEKPFDPAKEKLFIGVDTIPGGNKHAAELGNKKLDEGLEVLMELGNEQESQIRIASNYDFHTRLYGKRYGMLPVNEEQLKDDSGIFNPWKLAVSVQMDPPDSKVFHPMEDTVVGKMIKGTTDFNDPAYNSLTFWQSSGDVVEMRIPWMLLGFTDPSSLQVMSYQEKDKAFVTETTKGIRLLPWIMDKQTKQVSGLGSEQSVYQVSGLPSYTWKPWENVTYSERKKHSYYIMQKAFKEIDKKLQQK